MTRVDKEDTETITLDAELGELWQHRLDLMEAPA